MNSSIEENSSSLWKDAWIKLSKNRLALFGLAILCILIVTSLLTPFIAPYGYEAQNLELGATSPSIQHWLGTDIFGRDMLTRIRNGQTRLLAKVEMPSSNLRLKILEVLKTEGFISSYHIEKKENNKISLIVSLKYYEGTPVIREIKRISKPGRRVYSRATSIPRIQNGLGLAIISTTKGVMSDIDARKNNIGGEVICKVF